MQNAKMKRHKEKIIRTRREKIFHEIVFVFFVIYAFTLLYPFLFLFINSLKINTDEIQGLPLWLPVDSTHKWDQFPPTPWNELPTLWNPLKWNWSSYSTAFNHKDVAIVSMFTNTIKLAIGQTFVSMSLTCMAAYTLAKYRFRGNTFIYTFVLVCSVVPVFGAEAATFNLMGNVLNLRNTYIGMLLMCGAFGSAFLYLHSFFKSIPWSFAESAMIDGASDFRIFLQIMLPLAKNGVMVFTIMKFIGYWNDYWATYLYYCDMGSKAFKHHWTIAVGLSRLEKDNLLAAETNVYFAATLIAVVPMLIFYAVFSDKLMGNLNAGGIKG